MSTSQVSSFPYTIGSQHRVDIFYYSHILGLLHKICVYYGLKYIKVLQANY